MVLQMLYILYGTLRVNVCYFDYGTVFFYSIVRAQGEFLHDATCNETLVEFTRRLCSMNVYSLFFDYATVITNDMKEPSTVGDQHPTLNRFKDVRCLDHTRVKVPTKYVFKIAII